MIIGDFNTCALANLINYAQQMGAINLKLQSQGTLVMILEKQILVESKH